MIEKERLQKLNRYLLSKGRPPRKIGKVDYVKENMSRLKKRPATGNGTILQEMKISNEKISEPNLKKRKIALRADGKTSGQNKTFQTNKVNTSSSKKRPAYAPKSGSCEKLIGKVRDGPPRRQQLHAISQPCKNIKKTRNPAITSRGGKKEESSIKKSSEAHRKKLVRRSVHVIRQKDKGFPRTPNKSPVKRIMRTKTPSASQAKTPTNKLQCRSAGPKIASKSYTNKTGNMGLNREQLEMYNKLNSWLIAKGKKPVGGKKIRGFKAIKTISTPVSSPSQPCKTNTNGGSHWQGLRDEDESDEITVLIKHTLAEVQNCINEGCSTDTLVEMLEELADNLPVAKQQANYWIIMAEIEEQAGKSEEFICDLFEKAIQAKAEPVAEIMEAIKRLAMDKVEGKSKVPLPDEDLDIPLHELEGSNGSRDWSEEYSNMDSSNFEKHEIPNTYMKTPNPTIEKLIGMETPSRKNVATSPIVFNSLGESPFSMTTLENSPSSVVKLMMIPKSSPIFNKYIARRALSSVPSAIVTPVRRSRRIESAQGNYPKGLREHEHCLSSVQELLPALQTPSNGTEAPAITACNILFNPNHALSKEGCDIVTVLRF